MTDICRSDHCLLLANDLHLCKVLYMLVVLAVCLRIFSVLIKSWLNNSPGILRKNEKMLKHIAFDHILRLYCDGYAMGCTCWSLTNEVIGIISSLIVFVNKANWWLAYNLYWSINEWVTIVCEDLIFKICIVIRWNATIDCYHTKKVPTPCCWPSNYNIHAWRKIYLLKLSQKHSH